MATEVVLTVTEGRLKGREFVFRGEGRCVAGRAPDCYLYVPDDYRNISRHHCQFDINPPRIEVRDLGSLNGTYVNGERIGGRKRGSPPGQAQVEEYRARGLNDGDEVRIGDTVVRVHVLDYASRDALPSIPR
jgi:pSer/pThr/pTyr-binding forkhead associated (FHA) protein